MSYSVTRRTNLTKSSSCKTSQAENGMFARSMVDKSRLAQSMEKATREASPRNCKSSGGVRILLSCGKIRSQNMSMLTIALSRNI